MCDCQKKMIERLKALYPQAEGITPQVEMLSGRMYSEVKLKMPGKKKEQIILMLHSYCPMCGKKYEEANDGQA